MLLVKHANLIAAMLLLLMAGAAVLSLWGDSATYDEVAHIVAGYSYLIKQDYRLNPEHPPLLKDLAALPLVFLGLSFPDQNVHWTGEVNGQWDLGRVFLYGSGNNADTMLFWSRLPTVALMLLLGLFLFKWSKERYGPKAGLFALALYSFSPSVLANGRLATLDVGLTAFIFVAFYYFWRYLERPTRLSFGLAAVSFTLAQLSKFPAVLLVPVFFVLVLMKGHSMKAFGAMLLLSVVAVSLFYGVNMWNMPLEVQHRLIEASIQDGSGSYGWLASFLRWVLHGLADIAPLRPCSQYLLGLFMDGGHAFGGHTIYFLGEVGSHFWLYYPVVFLIKEPLASQAFLVGAVAIALRRRARPGPLPVGVMAFCLLYLAVFTGFGAQLGIRYVLPVFPFLYMLAAGQTAKLRGRPGLLGVSLLGWLAVSSLLVFPSYLAYYNELVGGPRNGYLYLGDSNTDWGQDLRRLTGFVEERGITAIRVNYFGGGDPAYYLGARYVPWDAASGPSGGWFAVSASFYEGRSADYAWLAGYTPVAQIGYSILVYNIPA